MIVLKQEHSRVVSVGTRPEYSTDPLVDCKQMISEAAYYLAQKRGFAPGLELSDWLHAEREIEAQLSGHCYD